MAVASNSGDAAEALRHLGARPCRRVVLGCRKYEKQAAQQQECYDAGECADRVLYYKIECDRDDVECLARKRRLAASKINGFFDNPTSQPGILVFALFFFAGPISAVVRTIATLINGPNDEPPPDDPGEPPRKDSYGPGAPW